MQQEAPSKLAQASVAPHAHFQTTLNPDAEQPQAAPHAPPVCIESVKQTFGIDEPAAIRDALALFPQPALQHVHQTLDAIKRADAVTAQVTLHKFKSSSRFVGAYPLGDLLEAMQRLAERRRLSELASMREHLLYEVRRVLSFIEDYARH